METDFSKASEPKELSSFDLAKALHEKMRFINPELAFGVTRELVVPMLKDLGTPDILDQALKALSPDTDNIDVEDRIRLPFDSQTNRSLRDVVFPKPQTYAETGSESNQQLARILNRLGELGRVDPIEAMRRHDSGEQVLKLPQHPHVASEEKRKKERLERGQEFKKETLGLFVSELQGLLYDGRNMIGSRLQHALYILPERLTGGDQIQKTLSTVINDFGSVGAILRDGHDLKSAVEILKRSRQMRSNNDLKKELT